MHAAILQVVGRVPEYGQFKEPEPGDGLEVVDVLLAGLNPADLLIAAGQFGPVEVPCVVGLEGIARRADGSHVYFSRPPAPFGSMAALAPVDPATTFAVPDGLDPGLAVALGIAGLAAWLPLEWRAQLRAGETVLVLGASGVVGQLGVQAAKLLGAGRVVAAARSQDVLARLRERGVADATVTLGGADDARELAEAAPDGYDVVLDTLYGPPLEAALPATNVGARIVIVGALAGQAITLPLGALSGRTLIGHSNSHAPLEVRRTAYERMARHAAAGELTVEVERLPLFQVAEAWARQARGPHQKLTLVP